MDPHPAPPKEADPRPKRRRRRAVLYGVLLLVVGLVLLNPYARQSLFGPTVRDMPVCYWQEQFRLANDPNSYQSSGLNRLLEWLGLRRTAAAESPHGRDMLPVYLGLVDDRSVRVRRNVAHAIAALPGSPESDAALLRLLDDADAQVRADAAYGITFGRPDLKAALPRLTELMDDPSGLCRAHAAEAAYLISGKKLPRAVPVLTAVLSDPDGEARSVAVQALTETADPAALPAVAACVTQDSSFHVRRTGAFFLKRFGRPAVPALVTLLRDVNPSVREVAAASLGELGERARAAVPALEALRQDTTESVREQAAAALSRIDPERYPVRKDEP
jgi:HEAT repeat protein